MGAAVATLKDTKASSRLTRPDLTTNLRCRFAASRVMAGFNYILKSLATILSECGSDVGPSLSTSPLAARTRASVPVGQRRRFTPAFRIRPRVRLQRRPRGRPCRG
jgi:hypothetical protein